MIRGKPAYMTMYSMMAALCNLCRNEFRRCGMPNFPPVGVPVVDSFRIFSQQEPRNLAAAVQFYCGRPFKSTEAHSALGDAQATLRVLLEQVRMLSLPVVSIAGHSSMSRQLC
jgi:DNA polymerase III epsilon subunit-like protein